MSGSKAPLPPRPPQYPISYSLPLRKPGNDKAAIGIAVNALVASDILSEERESNTDEPPSKPVDKLKSLADSLGLTRVKDMVSSWPSFAYGSNPRTRLPLKSMYDDTCDWPKKAKDGLPRYAVQPSWGNIGFPYDQSLSIREFEEATHIMSTDAAAIEMKLLVNNVLTKPAQELVVAQDITRIYATRETGLNRRFEAFEYCGKKIAKVKFEDCDVWSKHSQYGDCKISRHTESIFGEAVGKLASLEVEQRVAADVILATAGQVGGSTARYWQRAHDVAQQQLFKDTQMQSRVERENNDDLLKDAALSQMLSIVKKAITTPRSNPYQQHRRNEYATNLHVYHHIEDRDIVMVLDKDDKVITFSCSDALGKLLSKGVQNLVTESHASYSTFQPVSLLDMTLNGLHYVDWLTKNPRFDFRVPTNDPRSAKSGVYHLGLRCYKNQDDDALEVNPISDSGSRTRMDEMRQVSAYDKLRYNALGA